MQKAVREYLGYNIYFWSNEYTHIYVHVCKGKPEENATRIEITSSGVKVVGVNNTVESGDDLKKILRYIEQNRAKIIEKWYDTFSNMDLS